MALKTHVGPNAESRLCDRITTNQAVGTVLLAEGCLPFGTSVIYRGLFVILNSERTACPHHRRSSKWVAVGGEEARERARGASSPARAETAYMSVVALGRGSGQQWAACGLWWKFFYTCLAAEAGTVETPASAAGVFCARRLAEVPAAGVRWTPPWLPDSRQRGRRFPEE